MMIVSTYTEGEIIDPESRAELNTDSGLGRKEWHCMRKYSLDEELKNTEELENNESHLQRSHQCPMKTEKELHRQIDISLWKALLIFILCAHLCLCAHKCTYPQSSEDSIRCPEL